MSALNPVETFNSAGETVVGIARTRDEVFAEMLERISTGESVSAICGSGGQYPDIRTFWRWIASSKDNINLYEAALAMRAHVYAEELTALADDSRGDIETRYDKDGNAYQVINNELVARSKLRINTRQWIVSKLLPKKYGDRLELGGGGASLTISISQQDDKLL